MTTDPRPPATDPRVALLTEANSPGPFRGASHRDRWTCNSVEAIAAAVGADVFHGSCADDIALETLRDRYDVLIVNLKPLVWDAVPGLVRALPGAVVCGYQEGPSDLLATLSGPAFSLALAAHRAVECLFVYDADADDFVRRINPAVAWLPLPAPVDAYDRLLAEESLAGRRAAAGEGTRVLIGPTLGAGRGAALSLAAVAQAAPGATVVAHARGVGEAGRLAKLAAAGGLVPDIEGWLDWAPPPPARFLAERVAPGNGSDRLRLAVRDLPHAPPTFLGRLAGCDCAVNLDPAMCYGRLAVDCAGLGVPCVGSKRQAVQPRLWPALTVRDPVRDLDAAEDLIAETIHDSGLAQARATAARRALGVFTPDLVRTLFLDALEKETSL